MEIESRLDENFLFYLNFVASFLRQITDLDFRHQSEVWVERLLTEKCDNVERKRCRNIYLSQLLICMQSGEFCGPFLKSPDDIDISNAYNDFQLLYEEEQDQDWLNDTNMVLDDSEGPKKGRTYLATRTLPNGRGAMAYVAVSIGDEAPIWLGSGEGLNKDMEDKYKEYVPEYEMGKVLARRKDPSEREKVITYHKVLLQNIEDELDGKIEPEKNEDVNRMLRELAIHLQNTGGFARFEQMPPCEQRCELLTLLFGHIENRITNTKRLEEMLDGVEAKIVTKSFFENSPMESDKAKLPAHMWEQIINKAPAKKHVDKLHSNYPVFLVEKYLELLASQKEDIAVRIQTRYENIITQMKKEVRKEGEKGKRLVGEAQQNYDEVSEILRIVRNVSEKQKQANAKHKQKSSVFPSDQTKVYEEMKMALIDTQNSVEEEALKGKYLAGQINYVNQQTEIIREVNDERLRETDETNVAVMNNIKRLNVVIKQHQDRIKQIEAYAKHTNVEEI